MKSFGISAAVWAGLLTITLNLGSCGGAPECPDGYYDHLDEEARFTFCVPLDWIRRDYPRMEPVTNVMVNDVVYLSADQPMQPLVSLQTIGDWGFGNDFDAFAADTRTEIEREKRKLLTCEKGTNAEDVPYWLTSIRHQQEGVELHSDNYYFFPGNEYGTAYILRMFCLPVDYEEYKDTFDIIAGSMAGL